MYEAQFRKNVSTGNGSFVPTSRLKFFRLVLAVRLTSEDFPILVASQQTFSASRASKQNNIENSSNSLTTLRRHRSNVVSGYGPLVIN